jgi:hypothetical protein
MIKSVTVFSKGKKGAVRYVANLSLPLKDGLPWTITIKPAKSEVYSVSDAISLLSVVIHTIQQQNF